MFASKSWVTGGVAALLLAGAAVASGPSNGDCNGAIAFGMGGVTSNTCDAFASGGSCNGVTAGKALWYSFTAAAAGNYQFDTKGSGFDTVMLVYSGCGGAVLGCNDDTYGLASAVRVSLAAGQEVRIAVGGFGSACGDLRLNVGPVPSECCYPWDNGEYDGRNAQTSQVGFDRDWQRFARVTADDFWLCEDNVYRIRTLRGVMMTDAVVPKAQVVILRDCDGTPINYPVAIADSLGSDPGDLPFAECALGSVEIRETGGMTSDGFRIIEVTATFPKLWLEGGQYWVAFVGYSGTADPEEQFFWGTSGNNVVKGRPGKFFNSDDQSWTDIDLLCCGCTDFNFCIQGEKCKVLLDNGRPDFALMNGGPAAAAMVPGAPSLQNGTRTADKSRTADDFVVPPCSDLDLCYIEAYVLTNCDRVRLDIFDAACKCPAESEPILTLDAQCVTEVGRYGPMAGPGPIEPLRLLKAQFFDFKAMPLQAGRNYWVSVYALGDNSQNARGYFLWNQRCDTKCRITFNPGCTKGPAYNISRWEKSEPYADFAFMVAVYDANEPAGVIAPPLPEPCAADFNGQGGVTVQDVFDFLAAWFAGCP